jgi:hypothetical protein
MKAPSSPPLLSPCRILHAHLSPSLLSPHRPLHTVTSPPLPQAASHANHVTSFMLSPLIPISEPIHPHPHHHPTSPVHEPRCKRRSSTNVGGGGSTRFKPRWCSIPFDLADLIPTPPVFFVAFLTPFGCPVLVGRGDLGGKIRL